MITATLMSCAEKERGVFLCSYTAAEVANKLGVSSSRIRRAAKKLGVTRIHGPTVKGFVRFACSPVDIALPYYA